MSRKRKYIYCTNCGEKNIITNKKCSKCKKDLNNKDHLFKDYLYSHIKDDIKDNITDKLLSVIKGYITSHMYGTVMLATILLTTTSAIINNNILSKDITYVSDDILLNHNEPVIANNCDIENMQEQIKICPNEYKLENDKCSKKETIDANINYICNNGYTYQNGTCVSNDSTPSNKTYECLEPTTPPSGIRKEDVITAMETGNKCYLLACSPDSYDSNGICTSDTSVEIDYTLVNETCPSGMTLINGVCKTTSNARIEYTCNNGSLDGNKCIITDSTKYTLECPDGYRYNKDCKMCEKE